MIAVAFIDDVMEGKAKKEMLHVAAVSTCEDEDVRQAQPRIRAR